MSVNDLIKSWELFSKKVRTIKDHRGKGDVHRTHNHNKGVCIL
jgi:hypothetical protein